MIYPTADYLINHLGVPYGIIRYPNNRIEINIIDVIPLQFTGILDQDKVKIYDGDILEFGYPEYTDKRDAVWEVVFDTYHFPTLSLRRKPKKEGKDWKGREDGYIYYDWSSSNLARSKIIGNRFENPELLKQ